MDTVAPTSAPPPGHPTGSPQLTAQSRSLGDLERQKAYLQGRMTSGKDAVPRAYRGVIQKAFDGVASPRQAIKAKCLDCGGFMRAEVAHCQVIHCPLWPYRPYQRGEDDAEQEVAA